MCKNIFLMWCFMIIFTIFSYFKGSSAVLEYPETCQEVFRLGHKDTGLYRIQLDGLPRSTLAYCNMEVKGGGWTVFLHRRDDSQPFVYDQLAYFHGFGNLARSFWWGLERIHLMTRYVMHELYVEITEWDGTQKNAYYKYFSIGDKDESFYLKLVGGYNGTAGDVLTPLGGRHFVAFNDTSKYPAHCAVGGGGGWWYDKDKCNATNPTGLRGVRNSTGMYWNKPNNTLAGITMMIRPW